VQVVAFRDPEKPEEWEPIGDRLPVDEFAFPSIADMPENKEKEKAKKFDISTKKALTDLLKKIEAGDEGTIK